MPIAYHPEREARVEDAAHVQASGFNPSGVWELHPHQLRDWSFPVAYDGKVVKLVWDWLKYMRTCPMGYAVIAMRRHPEEVHQSYQAAVGGQRVDVRYRYRERLDKVLTELQRRDDVVQLVELDYATVVQAPHVVFHALAEEGWPIDWRVAAQVPNLLYYRFRLHETIVEGA